MRTAWKSSRPSDEAWRGKHREKVDRRRRLIFNNDGNEPVYYCKDATAQSLLESRTTPLAGSQVDSIFYCTWSSGFGLFTHQTKAGQVFNTREKMFTDNRTQELLDRGIDPLQVMVDFAHQHEMELFWSMRMNDTHDGARAEYAPVMFRANKLKQAHPEWLIGSKDKPPKYGAWSAVDYGVVQIRDLAFAYCEEVCQNYDIDGIELDFFRHVFLFRCSGRGNACGETELNALSELMRRIRSMTEQVARKRNRPILLAIRVPDSVAYCKTIGIDLEKWLSEGLIDLLVAGGYTQLNPWEYSVALGHKYGVKVYPSLDEPRVRDEAGRKLRESPATYRGRALNAWAAGADGIYMFNFFNPQSSLWRELGDPSILDGLDRNYFASDRGAGSMPVPHQKFIRVPILNPANPVEITADTPARVEFRIDKLPPTAAKLQLKLRMDSPREQFEIFVNGKPVSGGEIDGVWRALALDPKYVHAGVNEVTVAYPRGGTRSFWLLDLYLSTRID
jgi:hypothetical protein